jgi:hypothetical protein
VSTHVLATVCCVGVQATQQTTAKTCIDTYTNFKQLSLSKDGASHCLYFLNTAYSDPAFTSAEDTEDPMVIVKLDISNGFGSLCTRLVLDVLSDKASREYECGIKVDEDFETVVHELRTYFGFFKLVRTCDSILRFYSYDGPTNYVKCKTGGLQVESSGIHGFLSGHASPPSRWHLDSWDW